MSETLQVPDSEDRESLAISDGDGGFYVFQGMGLRAVFPQGGLREALEQLGFEPQRMEDAEAQVSK